MNEPRPLDLDLISFGPERRETPRLTLPHPRAAEREFVLVPLAEIAPELRLPGYDQSVVQLLEKIRN
jgi:2-amino-4-hydroxy-6-hydroxymethyldihydropteridine diphosphokinase